MSDLSKFRRIVVKIGTSTLTHDEGHLNLRRIEALVKVLSDFKNAGKQVILVSSGAVSAGVARMSTRRPINTAEKQAMAAIGQSELMKLYSRLFSDYGHTVAQILLTKDVIDQPARRAAAEDTFSTLLGLAGLIAVDLFGAYIGITLGVNLINAAVVGILGLPGLTLLLLLRWLCGI